MQNQTTQDVGRGRAARYAAHDVALRVVRTYLTSRAGPSRLQLALGGSLLFALNFFVCHELFWTEYTDRVISGDAAFISISRYMLDHWRDASWWPIWYNGIPGHDAYPPLLHAIVALLAALEHISPALAHHQFASVVYALAPVGLFFFAERMFRSVGTALVAGIAFSLVSPSTILIPWVRLNAGGWFGPWRLCVLGAYGDAPHMFAFALIPFAILALDTALARRRPLPLFVAALPVAAILLTNWLGSVALACTLASYLIATTNARADLSRWAITALIVVNAYLLACPWLPPSTIRLVLANGQVAEGDFRADVRQMPLRVLALAIVLLLAKLTFIKRKTPAGIQFGAFLVLLPGSFPVLWDWAQIAIVPQSHRYQWEMDFALCLIGAALVAVALKKLPASVKYASLCLVLLLGSYQLRAYRKYAAALIKPIDMTTTIEYKTADWLNHNHPHDRVFAIGTVAYWLNNFSDVPQASGGFEPGTPTSQDATALKVLSTTSSAETTLLWLRALGADLAVVGGPKTRAPFRVFSNPERFDRVGQKVWSDGDDFIYLIPRRSRSLAHVLRREDTTDIHRYVAAQEDIYSAGSFLLLADQSFCSRDGKRPAGRCHFSSDHLHARLARRCKWFAAEDTKGLPRVHDDRTGMCWSLLRHVDVRWGNRSRHYPFRCDHSAASVDRSFRDRHHALDAAAFPRFRSLTYPAPQIAASIAALAK